MKKSKKLLLLVSLLLGLLCMLSFPLYASEDDSNGDSYDWGAFQVTVTPKTEVAPGKEVTFDVTITNIRKNVSNAEIYKWYYRETNNSETYPGVDFGDLANASGTSLEAGSSITCTPNEAVELTLTGTIPDTWNKKSEILVVLNDEVNGYFGQGAYPPEGENDSDDSDDPDEERPVPEEKPTPNPAPTPTPTPSQTPSTIPAPQQEPVSPVPGTSVEDSASNGSYTVSVAGTSGTATVQYVEPVNKKASSVIVPDTVVVNGVTCKVTSISPNAFKNNKKIKKVKIGKNIEKIGANTFNGCKNLKTIVIKTTKLTAKKIGAKAFAKIGKNATIKVPKKALKKYKKILEKKGIDSSVKIK